MSNYILSQTDNEDKYECSRYDFEVLHFAYHYSSYIEGSTLMQVEHQLDDQRQYLDVSQT